MGFQSLGCRFWYAAARELRPVLRARSFPHAWALGLKVEASEGPAGAVCGRADRGGRQEHEQRSLNCRIALFYRFMYT